MNLPKKLAAVFLIMALAVFVPRVVWVIFDTYALGHPDTKFGAWHGIEFAAFFMGIAALVAGVSAVVVVGASVLARKSDEQFPHLLTALIGGLVLSFASVWIPDLLVYGVGYAVFGEIGMVMVNWAVVSAIVLLLVRAAAGRLPPNNRLLSDASRSALRASSSAPKPGR
jgi:hypothetical protein